MCVLGDSLGAEVGLEISKILHSSGLALLCAMIDPSPPPDLDIIHLGENTSALPRLFALTAADYLNQHSQSNVRKLEEVVRSTGAKTIEDLSYEDVAGFMSKPDYSVIAAATQGTMNILDNRSWGHSYNNLPVNDTPSFPGKVILFLCEHGLEFYEAFSGTMLVDNPLLSNDNYRGWTQRQLSGNVSVEVLAGSHFAINGIGKLG